MPAAPLPVMTSLRTAPLRRTAAVLLAATAVAASAGQALAGSTGYGVTASGERAPTPLRLKLVTTKQSTALRTGVLKIQVTVTEPSTVELVARGRGPTKASKQPVTESESARFVNRTTGIVRLKLTPSGRERLRQCGRQRLLVRGIARPSGPSNLVFAKSRLFKSLTPDPRRCTQE